jgi:2-methylcitrate dehydratase PrpD
MFDDDAVADKRVLALASRVTYVVDDSLLFPRTYGGRMTIVRRDGRERHVEEIVNRGHPDRPLDDDEVLDKFMSNARRRVDEATATKLADAISHLDELDSVDEVAELLQSP